MSLKCYDTHEPGTVGREGKPVRGDLSFNLGTKHSAVVAEFIQIILSKSLASTCSCVNNKVLASVIGCFLLKQLHLIGW